MNLIVPEVSSPIAYFVTANCAPLPCFFALRSYIGTIFQAPTIERKRREYYYQFVCCVCYLCRSTYVAFNLLLSCGGGYNRVIDQTLIARN